MHVKVLTVFLILAGHLLPVNAGETSLLIFGGENVHLATKDRFHVTYNDLVTGGCLPRPARLKSKLEGALRKHGFEVHEAKRTSGNQITINALGYRYGNNTCLVHLSAELEYFAATTVPYANTMSEGNSTFSPILHKIGATFYTGSRRSMQGRLEKKAFDFGEKIVADISKAKAITKKHFPQIIEEYERSKAKQLAQEQIEDPAP